MKITMLLFLLSFSGGNVFAQQGYKFSGNPETDTVWGKPVKFYLQHPKCAKIAKDFYRGKYKPADNDSTKKLLALVTTDNAELRPFYRWILTEVALTSEGALDEFIGLPMRRYAEKYPAELLAYLDADNFKYEAYKTTLQSVFQYYISKSGIYNSEINSLFLSVRDNFFMAMKKNCIDCTEDQIDKLKKFAKETFADPDQFELIPSSE